MGTTDQTLHKRPDSERSWGGVWGVEARSFSTIALNVNLTPTSKRRPRVTNVNTASHSTRSTHSTTRSSSWCALRVRNSRSGWFPAPPHEPGFSMLQSAAARETRAIIRDRDNVALPRDTAQVELKPPIEEHGVPDQFKIYLKWPGTHQGFKLPMFVKNACLQFIRPARPSNFDKNKHLVVIFR